MSFIISRQSLIRQSSCPLAITSKNSIITPLCHYFATIICIHNITRGLLHYFTAMSMIRQSSCHLPSQESLLSITPLIISHESLYNLSLGNIARALTCFSHMSVYSVSVFESTHTSYHHPLSRWNILFTTHVSVFTMPLFTVTHQAWVTRQWRREFLIKSLIAVLMC